MVRHYLQLLLYYRWLVAGLVLGIPSLVAVFSVLFLKVMPIYTASAKVSMLPTESELAFTHAFLQSSQFAPANMMTQTHMEYLVSRPVAAATLDRLIAESGTPSAEPKSTGWVASIGQKFREFKWALQRWYNILNYGVDIPLEPYEDLIESLIDNIKVEAIEGTYILEIAVSWDDPGVAAKAANLLALEYVERVRKQTGEASDKLQDYLEDEIKEQEGLLAGLQAHRTELSMHLGVHDIGRERQALLDMKAQERKALLQARADLSAQENRLAAMTASRDALHLLGREQLLNADIALSEPNRAEIRTRMAAHESQIDELGTELERLAEAESSIVDVDFKIGVARDALSQLNEQIHNLEVGRASGLSNLRVIDPAIQPLYPSFPRVLVFVVIASAASVLLACFAVVLLDTLSETAKTSADLERVFGERALGVFGAGVARSSRRLSRAGASVRRRMRMFVGAGSPGAVMGVSDDALADCGTAILGGAPGAGGGATKGEAAAAGPASLGGAGGSFTWQAVDRGIEWLAVVARAGETTESELRELVKEAHRRGIREVFGVLVMGRP
jgi:uncharacterized protein involved in exopolysaccharide biosynthesis